MTLFICPREVLGIIKKGAFYIRCGNKALFRITLSSDSCPPIPLIQFNDVKLFSIIHGDRSFTCCWNRERKQQKFTGIARNRVISIHEKVVRITFKRI